MDNVYFRSIVNSLKSVKRAGDYATGGVCSMTSPSLSLNDMPDVILSLPIDESQVKSIVTQAPYNSGEDTTTVCCTWQLSPKQFSINSVQWQEQLCALVDIVKDKLGCGSIRVTCQLRKLLLYEPSGSFKVSLKIARACMQDSKCNLFIAS